MQKISLKFADSELTVNIPEETKIKILGPREGPKVAAPVQQGIVAAALASPIGAKPLAARDFQGSTVAIVVSDITRLAPSRRILPPILEDLAKAGIRKEDISIVIGLGNHRVVTDEEKRFLLGPELVGQYCCRNSKEGKYVALGVTSRGTPVEISEFVAGADLKIFTGNIEPHRLAGFSGGVKGYIGISSPLAIEHNHKLSKLGDGGPGKMAGNPVWEDLKDYARKAGANFLVNVVTDEEGNIERAVAGDIVEAHKQGTLYAAEKYLVPLHQNVNLVLVSAGGKPKDSSLYQALKAIQNAAEAMTPGGVIIAVASCQEGFGDKAFENWVKGADSSAAIISRSEKEFVLGGHKAVMLAKLLQKAGVFFVSEMASDDVKMAGFEPFESLQEAVNKALLHLQDPNIMVMPYGAVTFPMRS